VSAAQPNPYAPPTANVADSPTDADGIQLAGRGARLGGFLLDVLIYLVFFLPAFVIEGFGSLATFENPTPAALSALMAGTFGVLILIGGIAWAVITLILVKRNGQTIGKKLIGIKVVRSDGSKASLGRIFWLRNVVNSLPSLLPVVGGLYFFIDSLFIFTESQQCVHDKIADTIVVKA